MSIIEDVVSLFAPHSCVGCDVEEDRLLCEGCSESLALVPSRCYRCKAVTPDYVVCEACKPHTPLRQVAVYTHYTGLAKELLHRMKYERARAGAGEVGRLLAAHGAYFPPNLVLVHVPTATSRVRMRGYDHAALLAREISRNTGLLRQRLLTRVGQAHQVGARRAERLRQLEDAFRPIHPECIRGKHVVLVDDVLTTGATLETAARVLRRAGAARVSAIVFAQA